MNWLHAFRMAGGDLSIHRIDEVIEFIENAGYAVVRDIHWIEEIISDVTGRQVYARRQESIESIHAHILECLPTNLVIALNANFGRCIGDSYEPDPIFIKPNVGAATILPLPK